MYDYVYGGYVEGGLGFFYGVGGGELSSVGGVFFVVFVVDGVV